MKPEALARSILHRRNPDLQSGGFGRAMREIAKESGDLDLLEKWRRITVVPDMFSVHRNARLIRVVEIENTSNMKPNKIGQYIDLWHYLDCIGWELRVDVTDRYGLSVQTLPLMDWFYDELIAV